MSEYGIRPSNDGLMLSTYLGCHKNDIQIGDVTSQADTKTSSNGAYLGEYAGKALGASNGHFEFETKDHGLLFITQEILVRSSYVQGIKPEFQLLDRFDFFQPEFDNLGMTPISTRELVFDRNDGIVPEDNVFGFTPTYSKYKYCNDTLSGDFIIPSLGGGLDGNLSSWWLSRYFTESENLLFVSEDFQRADNMGNGSNYDRIFQVADGDHFYQIFQINIQAFRPMKSISDAITTNDPDNHGKHISVQHGGHVS